MTEMARALSKEIEKNEQLEKQLTEAKEILQMFVNANRILDMLNAQRKAEDFLKE